MQIYLVVRHVCVNVGINAENLDQHALNVMFTEEMHGPARPPNVFEDRVQRLGLVLRCVCFLVVSL